MTEKRNKTAVIFVGAHLPADLAERLEAFLEKKNANPENVVKLKKANLISLAISEYLKNNA